MFALLLQNSDWLLKLRSKDLNTLTGHLLKEYYKPNIGAIFLILLFVVDVCGLQSDQLQGGGPCKAGHY